MLRIDKDFDFDQFEDSLQDIQKNQKLKLATRFKHTGYWGIDAALIQLLLTWSRKQERSEIVTYINDSDSTEIRRRQLINMGRRLYGISALYLANTVSTAQGSCIPEEEYKAWCNQVLEDMQNCDIYSPESIKKTYPNSPNKVATQFVCLHNGRHEFQKSLYKKPSRNGLISRSEFSSLVRNIFLGNKRFSTYINFDREFNIAETIGTFLYEVFQNTNDHAYERIDGTLYAKNVRSFIVKGHSDYIASSNLSTMKSKNDRFKQYLSDCIERFKKSGSSVHRFLEISIVDGGMGFAQRFTGKPLEQLSDQEERKITIDCFNQGVSSKVHQSRGRGLESVWRGLCKLDGFIRLRSGRLCLFQTFDKISTNDEIRFDNWTEKPLKPAEGVVITIIIPCYFD